MRPQDPFTGRDILNGEFRILERIGTGGMGSVYKATQVAMNRLVAVKILHPKLASRRDLVSRFQREARAMSHLTHPNTVKVLLYGQLDDSSLYIVMEYLEGRNLAQTVRVEGPMPTDRALPILIQVCGALEEAHRVGIIHRDLKPENVFLCNQGGIRDFPKVLDFGLAKVTEREMRPGSVILTQEGTVFGTPEFMSPEQAQGKPLTPATDIYSLAVILYELLTGKLPFACATPVEFLQAHVQKPPIPLSARVHGLVFSQGLDDVMATALAKPIEARYATAEDFANALKPYVTMSRQLAAVLPVPRSVSPTIPDASARPPPVDPRVDAPFAAASAKGGLELQRNLGIGMLVAIAVGCMALGIVLTLLVTRLLR